MTELTKILSTVSSNINAKYDGMFINTIETTTPTLTGKMSFANNSHRLVLKYTLTKRIFKINNQEMMYDSPASISAMILAFFKLLFVQNMKVIIDSLPFLLKDMVVINKNINCTINNVPMTINYDTQTNIIKASISKRVFVSNVVVDEILIKQILEQTIKSLLLIVSLQKPDLVKMPDPYFIRVKSKTDLYNEKGIQKIVPYLAQVSLHKIFWTYLFAKYKSRCFSTKHRLIIQLEHDSVGVLDKNVHNLNIALKSVDAVVHCVMQNPKIFIIPIRLVEIKDDKEHGHANCLIYRRQYNHFEHFEPHGTEYNNGNHTQSINYILTKFIEKINADIDKKEKGRQPITLVKSSDVCPNTHGFQALEQRSSLFRTKDDADGYCAAWSMFFAEMCFKNPSKTSNELIQYILYSNPDDKSRNDYLRELIRGYAQIINDKLLKYISKIFSLSNQLSLHTLSDSHMNTLCNRIEELIELDDYVDLGHNIRFNAHFNDASSNSDKTSIDITPDFLCGPGKRCKKGTCKKGVCQVVKQATTKTNKTNKTTPPIKPPSTPPTVKQDEPICGPGKRCKKGTCKKGVCEIKNQPAVEPKPKPKQVEEPIVELKQLECGPGRRCKKGTCKKGICEIKAN